MAERRRVLVVDDEKMNLDTISAMLKVLGHNPDTARDGFEALAKLRLGADLVLMDVNMPGMDGFEVVRRARRDSEFGDVPIIMVTAFAGKEDRLRAVEAGANDFIAKPLDMAELRVRSESMLNMKDARDALKRHEKELEETVEKRTAALRQALEDMAAAQRAAHEAHLDTIHRLAVAAEYRDEDTAAHVKRVSLYSALLARRHKLTPKEVEVARIASPMHDVGKIGVPDGILLKPDRLTETEWEVMRQHTTIGGRILDGSSSELLQVGRVIALTHHEKWDGSGYPNGLSGSDIPLYGRIAAVADVFDALTSDRPYRERMPTPDALKIIEKGGGTHFDPRIVDLFLEDIDEVLTIEREQSTPGVS